MTSSRDAISALPVSYVMMSGTVTVDQQCVLNGLGAGQPISINFGNIMSTEFKTKGAMPKEFTLIEKSSAWHVITFLMA